MVKAYLSLPLLFITVFIATDIARGQGFLMPPQTNGFNPVYQDPSQQFYGSGQYMTAPPCGYGGQQWGGFKKDDEDDSVSDAKERYNKAKEEVADLKRKARDAAHLLREKNHDLGNILKDHNAEEFMAGLIACKEATKDNPVTESTNHELSGQKLALCINATSIQSSATSTQSTTSTKTTTTTWNAEDRKHIMEIPKPKDLPPNSKCTVPNQKRFSVNGAPFFPCYSRQISENGEVKNKELGEDANIDPKLYNEYYTTKVETIIKDITTPGVEVKGTGEFKIEGYCLSTGQYAVVSNSDHSSCKNLASDILKYSKDAQEMKDREVQARKDLAYWKRDLREVKKMADEDRKDKAERGDYDGRYESGSESDYCYDCHRARKEQHPILDRLLPIGAALGVAGINAYENGRIAAQNLKSGYVTGPSLPPSLNFSYPFSNSGFYGATYGGMGSGGFGCSPAFNGGFYGGGPWGQGAMYGGGMGGGMYGGNGYPYGGGMYMPGQAPWGYNGPWGAGGGIMGGIGRGLPYGNFGGMGYPGIGYPGGMGGGMYGGIGGGMGGGGYPGGMGGGGYPGGGMGGGIYGGIGGGMGGGYPGGIAGYPSGLGNYGAGMGGYGGAGGGFGLGGGGALGGLGGMGGYGGLGGVGGGLGGVGGYGGFGGYDPQIQQLQGVIDLNNRLARAQNINIQGGQLNQEYISTVNPGGSNLLNIPGGGLSYPGAYGGGGAYGGAGAYFGLGANLGGGATYNR